MRIEITTDDGRAPQTPSWTAIQALLQSAWDSEQRAGKILVRISRDDGGVNYRETGSYTVTLKDGTTVRIRMEREG